MNLSEKELKKVIFQVLAEQETTKASPGGAFGALGMLGDMDSNTTDPNDVVNLFLTAFGLIQPQQAQQGQQQAASGDSWVGLPWREVMQAMKTEFGIMDAATNKNWYRKLPYNDPARVKFREWYNSRTGA
tara:strand:- start:8874 stop:9263 length:390 start_codon:yes stop_codon:yes gene_type:complete